MRKDRLQFGTILGIPLRIDLSWLLIFVWLSWSLAGSYFPGSHPQWAPWLNWLLGIVTSLLFFGSVLLHELGHSLVARAQGIPVHQITLFIFGGAAEITEEPSSPAKEAWLALAGPLVSLTLGALFMVVYALTRRATAPVASVALYLGGINLSLGMFNLIPGFPLDGGRVLRAILWRLRQDLTWATRWATRSGQAVAYAFIVLGMVRAFGGDWVGGLWMAFIGLFLDGAARSASMQLTLRHLLEGHVAAEIMSSDCQLVPPQLTLDLLVEHYFMAQNRRCYVVGTPDRVLGMVTVHQVQEVPRAKWPFTRIEDVFVPLERLRKVEPRTPLYQVLQEMTEQGVNQLPVMEDGEIVGMVTRDRLLTFIRNRSALGLP